ncbi:MAG TPA: octanoyltransferase [Legionellales bacterium]|nr:octanoyltransferase [Legionellales bacterium]
MFIVRDLGIRDYLEVFEDMKKFTQERNEKTVDEIWLLEHFPVFTQGQAGKPEHVFHRGKIAIVQSDRGGQVTYHGPGQMIGYFLLNCQQNQIGIKQLVSGIEDLMIHMLENFHIKAHKICGAPGIYVDGKKIASLGLRIKNHCSYHGLALNVDMDLSPFHDINPCGYEKLQMTQIKDFCPDITMDAVKNQFQKSLMHFYHNNTLFKDIQCTM